MKFGPLIKGMNRRNIPVNYRSLHPSGASVADCNFTIFNNNGHFPNAVRILQHLLEFCRVRMHIMIFCSIAIG